MECLFCKIAQKIVPSTMVYEDDDVVAFNDIHPRAPIHQLIIPRKHIATLNELSTSDAALVGKMIVTAKQLAVAAHIADSGYRLVFNCNKAAGQEVYHIHLHVLGGRDMTWPPG